ncbi:MAG: agmatine/peptidylarginine deiminase [Runella sp.]
MTPQQRGFFFPAEWHPHRATWLSFPHTEASWTYERQPLMLPAYLEFIKTISSGEKVAVNAHNEELIRRIEGYLLEADIDLNKIELLPHPTNDSWCRDHGPGILINPTTKERLVINWGYNAWGGKYPPFDLDDQIPTAIGRYLGLEVVTPGIIMEGGSVEFNGRGTLLTSRACLLNPNRNPHLNQAQIEQFLCDNYGVEQILWVGDGIVGDDTDGHIDDTVRFVNEDTVVTVIEQNKADDNYEILKENLRELQQMRLLNDKPLNIVELPMPTPVYSEGLRLPASYANFYISNAAVIVPTFRCTQDQKALDILEKCFPDRPVVGIDATEIIWGLGSFHCLSQQEPLV